MHSLCISVLLIVSQAFLARALPAFHLRPFFHFKPDCNDYSPHILTLPVYPLAAAVPIEPTAASAFSTIPPRQTPASSEQGSTLHTSVTTFADPNLSLQTANLTEFPPIQSPTTTDATGSLPDTTGSIITTLETDGNPPVQPFPTSLSSISESTLVPTNVTALPNETATPQITLTETFTLPLSTFETVVTTQTAVSIAIETTATLTAVTVLNTTITSDGTAIATSVVGTTVVTVAGTALSKTTLQAASTETGTIATIVTTAGSPSDVAGPSQSSSCQLRMNCTGQDLFLPVSLGQPPATIPRVAGHPVPRKGINNVTGPIETNKFYSNFFLGSQSFPTFAIPYSLTWSKGSGNAQSWGMAISHIDDYQKVFGPPNNNIPNSPSAYYICPLGIQSIILSAAEFRSTTVLTSDELYVMSGNIHLSPNDGSSSVLTFPVVQGMGLVTGLYTNLQPVVQSSVFFRNVAASDSPKSNVFKFKVTLEDGKVWLIYATPDVDGLNPNFELKSSTLLQGISNWSGDIQIARLPEGASESIYDNAAGLYPTTGHLAGYSQGSNAQYSLSWNKGGPYATDGTLLMFALPHHVQSFDNTTRGKMQNLTLDTTTKGVATAVSSDYWIMEEQLPVDMGFAPWRPDGGQNVSTLSTVAISAIQIVSSIEASQNMTQQSDLNSMYYSGKALSKFATLIYTMYDLADQKQLALAALPQLESAFARFAENKQQFPLYYDTDWKGLVSSASYVTGDPGQDFGNSYYNDHHFHYGYFIHAASIIGHLDPNWLVQNKEYVNSLVRDTSNPSSLDQYYPVFRSFDIYHGHSWAKGLYETGDGKDEESSSEDAMYAYALKMWGKTVGDPSMEARGNWMLAVLTRSLQNYMLMDSSNINQPPQFIGNKVTGILFENKADHVTYFGLNPEYIQGIHMIPIMPFSTLTRTQQFVAEEWATYFADGAVAQASTVQGGWRGILYSNLAIINPRAAYNFFTQPDFDPGWLDGGATRTWYIALSAMLGGAP